MHDDSGEKALMWKIYPLMRLSQSSNSLPHIQRRQWNSNFLRNKKNGERYMRRGGGGGVKERVSEREKWNITQSLIIAYKHFAVFISCEFVEFSVSLRATLSAPDSPRFRCFRSRQKKEKKEWKISFLCHLPQISSRARSKYESFAPADVLGFADA